MTHGPVILEIDAAEYEHAGVAPETSASVVS